MQLTSAKEGTIDILTPSGSVNAGDDVAFGKALQELRRQKRFLLVIDARDLEYINSRAIGLLVQFSRDARLAGGKVAMVSPAPGVAKILKAVGLLLLVPIYANVEDAITACQGRPDGGRPDHGS
jgi:anti-anti-sigma factor